MRASLQRPLEKAGEYDPRVAVFLRDASRGAAVGGAVLRYFVRRGHRFVGRTEGKQSCAYWKVAAKAGVLHNDRSSRGQVPRGAVAEPPAMRVDVNPLRRRQLGG